MVVAHAIEILIRNVVKTMAAASSPQSRAFRSTRPPGRPPPNNSAARDLSSPSKQTTTLIIIADFQLVTRPFLHYSAAHHHHHHPSPPSPPSSPPRAINHAPTACQPPSTPLSVRCPPPLAGNAVTGRRIHPAAAQVFSRGVACAWYAHTAEAAKAAAEAEAATISTISTVQPARFGCHNSPPLGRVAAIIYFTTPSHGQKLTSRPTCQTRSGQCSRSPLGSWRSQRRAPLHARIENTRRTSRRANRQAPVSAKTCIQKGAMP
jgi:hypothetical protein